MNEDASGFHNIKQAIASLRSHEPAAHPGNAPNFGPDFWVFRQQVHGGLQRQLEQPRDSIVTLAEQFKPNSMDFEKVALGSSSPNDVKRHDLGTPVRALAARKKRTLDQRRARQAADQAALE